MRIKTGISISFLFGILIVFFSFSLLFNYNAGAQSPSFMTFINPVIPGDHPDPTLTKIGNYYYTTGSSFNPTPKIFRSTDMVHWEVIAQPVPADWWAYGDGPMGGIWGGHIVYYNNKYWHFFGHWYTMWLVTADKPEGPWSQPVEVKKPNPLPSNPFDYGQDNSIFIDDNNKWYMLTKAGKQNNWIIELGPDGQPKQGGAVIDLRWLNADAKNNPYGWAEGPVMHKYKDKYYYYVSKSAGTTQYVFRASFLVSDSSAGKWEYLGELYNIAEMGNSMFTNTAHYSYPIQIADGTWWTISHSWANNKWGGQGRQGILSQVRWNTNDKPKADFPVNKPLPAPQLSSGGIPWMVPKSDFFSEIKLNPEWSFLGKTLPATWSLTERTGWFRLSPKADRANTIIKPDAERNYSLTTRMDFKASGSDTVNQAGIRFIDGEEDFCIKVFSSFKGGRKVICFSADSLKNNKFYKSLYFVETTNIIGDTVWLKLERSNHMISGYYSSQGNNWIKLGNDYDLESVDKDENMGSWTGNYQGLFVKGDATQKAYFDLYLYRDAYRPIPADYPANWYGTARKTLPDGTAVLDSISSNDWALYPGVEFGNGTFDFEATGFEAVASSAATGGNIEIWLDSINTGKKIGTCSIGNTGGFGTFITVSCPVERTVGRHDVYLRFTGSGTSVICQLKSLKFTGVKIQAVFYRDVNFSGTATSLSEGNYTKANLIAAGIIDNDISSFKVPAGYQVLLYDGDNFTQPLGVFTSDQNDLVSIGINDKTTSIIIRKDTVITEIQNDVFAKKNNMYLFPNPAKNQLIAVMENGEQVEKIELFNVFGMILKVANGDKIDVSDLAKGIYIANITGKKSKYTERIVIE